VVLRVPSSEAHKGAPAQIARLSAGDSERALTLIRGWMARLGIRSVDELSLSADNIKRSTLYRWFATHERGSEVRVRVQAVYDIVEALRMKADSQELIYDFSALLRGAESRVDRESVLISECRKQRVSFQRVLAAVRGARCRIVPED
jgi:hypothetical protein